MSTKSPKFIAAATVASAVAIFTVPVTTAPVAHAACKDWVLGPANLILNQDNGIEVDIYGWTGKAITNLPSGAPAYAQYWSNGTKTKGSATGNINGNVVEMNLNWNDGPGAGLSNYYYATIADDGTVFGTTTNSQNARNGFTSATKAKCNDAAAAPKPEPKPADTGGGGTPAAPGGTMNDHVDIYDVPGGGGTVIGQTDAGDKVTFIGECPIKNPDNPDDANNGWCKITDTTKNLTGAVWGDFITK